MGVGWIMIDVLRCGRCDRKLKDQKSVKIGFGRTCYKKHVAYVEKFYMNLFEEPEKKVKKKSA